MGSFYMKDFVTGQTIVDGDEIIAFIVSDRFKSHPLSYNSCSNGCYSNTYFSFSSLGIYGIYGDYGKIIPHDENSISIDFLCSYFGLKNFEEIYSTLLNVEGFNDSNNIKHYFGLTMIHKKTFELLTNSRYHVVPFDFNFEDEYHIFENKIKQISSFYNNDNLNSGLSRLEIRNKFSEININKTKFFNLSNYISDNDESLSCLFSFSENNFFDSNLIQQFEEKNLCGDNFEDMVINLNSLPNYFKEPLKELYMLKKFYSGLSFLHLPVLPSLSAGQYDISINSLFLHINNIELDFEKYLKFYEDNLNQEHLQISSNAIHQLEDILSKMRKKTFDFQLKIESLKNE